MKKQLQVIGILMIISIFIFPSIGHSEGRILDKQTQRYVDQGGVVTFVDDKGNVELEGKPDAIQKYKKGEALTYYDEQGIGHVFGDRDGNIVSRDQYLKDVEQMNRELTHFELQHLEHNKSQGSKKNLKDAGLTAQQADSLIDTQERDVKKFIGDLDQHLADETERVNALHESNGISKPMVSFGENDR